MTGFHGPQAMTQSHDDLMAAADVSTARRRVNTEGTTAALYATVARHALTVSGDGRVTEKDAAMLLGYSMGTVKAMRLSGDGPVHFTVGMNGCRISYRVEHLAAWIETGREV